MEGLLLAHNFYSIRAEKRRTIRYRQNLFSTLKSYFFLDSDAFFFYYLKVFVHPYRETSHTEAR